MIRRIAMSVAGAVTLVAASAHADELACVAGREKAAGQYAACQAKAKAATTGIPARFAKCQLKYAGTWEKLKAKNPGTTCDTTTRFVDNLDGTVTDHLAGLVWEKKDNSAGIHDVSNVYAWTAGDADPTDEDGAVFTAFLATLNAGGGFAGTNDWRLPTIDELQTILLPGAFPCTTSPCTVSELGLDAAGDYWSASTGALDPSIVWGINTNDGGASGFPKASISRARAVRAGS